MQKSFGFEVFLPNSLFPLPFFPFVYEIHLPLINIVTEKSQRTSHDIIIVVHFNTVVGFDFIVSMDFLRHSLEVLEIPMENF